MALITSVHGQVTRYYRPPELTLLSTDYSGAVDVWSIGCIFAVRTASRPTMKHPPRTQRDDMQADQTGLHHLFGAAVAGCPAACPSLLAARACSDFLCRKRAAFLLIQARPPPAD